MNSQQIREELDRVMSTINDLDKKRIVLLEKFWEAVYKEEKDYTDTFLKKEKERIVAKATPKVRNKRYGIPTRFY